MDLKEKTQNDNRHPWELSRTKNLLRIVTKNLLNKKSVKIADIGAGDMYFDKQLVERLKSKNIDPFIFAVDKEYSKEFLYEKEIFTFKDIQMLKKESMDCIIMMDVLEHIEDDSKFLKLVLERLKEDGILIITVPAFQSLFSCHDTFLLHFRRYKYKQLKNLLYCNNFETIYNHYFYTTLYFARWLQIRLGKIISNKRETGIGTWKYSKKSFITKTIELILNADFYINEITSKKGLRLPGLSLLVIAKKRLY